jgi:putative membrane protein
MMGHDFGFGIPGLGIILFWVVIIGLVVFLVRFFAGDRPSAGKTPRQILEERYARGEIDREELEQKRRDLSG